MYTYIVFIFLNFFININCNFSAKKMSDNSQTDMSFKNGGESSKMSSVGKRKVSSLYIGEVKRAKAEASGNKRATVRALTVGGKGKNVAAKAGGKGKDVAAKAGGKGKKGAAKSGGKGKKGAAKKSSAAARDNEGTILSDHGKPSFTICK